VPTGNRIKLDYAPQSGGSRITPPVLAVRLQELFGWTETPRIAGGRVPVRLHLLGPNYRPVQITDDLRSFWSTTYFQVRKDLRVRYPKHSWPEDPLSATPQAKCRPRQEEELLTFPHYFTATRTTPAATCNRTVTPCRRRASSGSPRK